MTRVFKGGCALSLQLLREWAHSSGGSCPRTALQVSALVAYHLAPSG